MYSTYSPWSLLNGTYATRRQGGIISLRTRLGTYIESIISINSLKLRGCLLQAGKRGRPISLLLCSSIYTFSSTQLHSSEAPNLIGYYHDRPHSGIMPIDLISISPVFVSSRRQWQKTLIGWIF